MDAEGVFWNYFGLDFYCTSILCTLNGPKKLFKIMPALSFNDVISPVLQIFPIFICWVFLLTHEGLTDLLRELCSSATISLHSIIVGAYFQFNLKCLRIYLNVFLVPLKII